MVASDDDEIRRHVLRQVEERRGAWMPEQRSSNRSCAACFILCLRLLSPEIRLKMKRWSDDETAALVSMREILKEPLAAVEPNVEVIGDRALLRFYRGHGNVQTACEFMRRYLTWRKEENIDIIRRAIVTERNSPTKFPHGETILEHIPQVLCNVNARDIHDCPLSWLTTDFSPTTAFAEINLEQYTEFIKYNLEFQQLVLEQLSEEKERQILADAEAKGEILTEPYGVIMQATIIRDLTGLSLQHLGPQGSAMSHLAIKLASANYPEILRKMYVVNAPWIFNTFFWGLKQILPARTLGKVSVMGGTFHAELHREVPPTSLPPHLGGAFSDQDHYSFEFDIGDGGLLHCPIHLRFDVDTKAQGDTIDVTVDAEVSEAVE